MAGGGRARGASDGDKKESAFSHVLATAECLCMTKQKRFATGIPA
jgi:hypothetical protein